MGTHRGRVLRIGIWKYITGDVTFGDCVAEGAANQLQESRRINNKRRCGNHPLSRNNCKPPRKYSREASKQQTLRIEQILDGVSETRTMR